jgi:hypothetical protein
MWRIVLCRDDYDIVKASLPSTTTWEEYALSDHSFKSNLSVWMGLNKLRLVLACVGWCA